MQYLKRNKLLLILLIIVIITLFLSFYFTGSIKNDFKEEIFKNIDTLLEGNKVNIFNNFINNELLYILIWIFGISIIGIIIIIPLLILKVFIYGFELCSLISYLKIKNLFLILAYLIPNTISLLFTFVISYYSISYSIYLIKFIFFHKKYNFNIITKKYLKILLISLIINIITTLLIRYIYPNLIHLKI